MPPRRSRRTAGKDPEQLEVVEKVEGKPGGGDDYLSKTVGQGKEVNADSLVQLEGAAIRDIVGSTEEKAEVGVKETVVTSKSVKEDLGKPSSVENPNSTEVSCCGEILQAGEGEGRKVVTNSEKEAQNTIGLGNCNEPSSSGGRGNHLPKIKKVASSGRRLNASSSEEDFYSGEEEVIFIFLLILLRGLSVCIKLVG